MAAGAMVTATGAVVILYLLSRRIVWARNGEDDPGGELGKSGRSGRRRIVRRPAQAPATWLETISTLSETLRFTYSETLGKWPIADLAFGINYLMRRQGNFSTASVYAGSNCIELKGPHIIMELTELLRFLTLCMLFSKKPFPVFLETAGYTHEDVLLQKPKAGFSQTELQLLDSCYRSHELVESPSGQRFLVKWYVGSPTMKYLAFNCGGTKRFMVFREEEDMNMSYTEDIGDLCIFLGNNEPFCVKASSFPGLKPNFIYFLGEGYGEGYGVYDIATITPRSFTPKSTPVFCSG
ncbi:PREDICTED: uncharacterized protein LOC109126846 [Camelina sativa]|uniref:Uncharacterized protein LOC109126846 n=1 Tax=Camelina sativa TaxID=90675 RepID=A0ABM1QHN0_CAMSA|nr:PREDICTED: uncharacterized protein LOC109126846 [Camelina sativa]